MPTSEDVHAPVLPEVEKEAKTAEASADVLHADHAPAGDEAGKVESWTPDEGAEQSAKPAAAGAVSEDAVIEAIATVHDPEIPVNIYELGLIYAIDLYDDGRVRIEMTLTAPNCPSAQELPVQVKEAVEKVPGVKSAEVEVVWDPPWDMSRMSDEARLALNMF